MRSRHRRSAATRRGGTAFQTIGSTGNIEECGTAGLLLRFTAGWFAAYTILTIAAAAGSPRPVTVALFFLTIAAVPPGSGGSYETGSWQAASGRAWAHPRWRPWLISGVILVLAAWAWPVFIQSLPPNSDWDGAVYHLPLGRMLFAGEFWSFDPVYWLYGSPGAGHLYYGLFEYIGIRQAVVPWNLLIAALVPVGAYCLVLRSAARPRGYGAPRFAYRRTSCGKSESRRESTASYPCNW